MKIHTQVGHYKAKPEKLFDLLSKEENLPRWAVKFCRTIEKKRQDHIITTTKGDKLYFAIDADPASGAVDMAVGPDKDHMWRGSHRVVSDNMGGSLFIFTLLQPPGESDNDFDTDCSALAEELEVIRGLVE